MEIREKTINENKYQLVNEYWETSNAWGHKTTIFQNGYEIEQYKCRYYNRTWESYEYQSCMESAVKEVLFKEKNRFIENYKYENNITRFKKGQKEEVIKLFDETEVAKELKELQKVIGDRSFD